MAGSFNSAPRRAAFFFVSVAIAVVLGGCVSVVERSTSASTTAPALTPVPTPSLAPASNNSVLPTTTSPTTVPTPSPTPTPIPTSEPTPLPSPSPTPKPELLLEVRGPEDGSTVSASLIVVHGVTQPGAKVTINDEPTEVDEEGRFQSEISLVPGENLIRVASTDTAGESVTRFVRLTSTALPPQPFFLLVTDPENQTIVRDNPVLVSGRTTPDAVLTVNGTQVPVDELGLFSTRVVLDEGPNVIEVVATGASRQVLSAILAVIYRP